MEITLKPKETKGIQMIGSVWRSSETESIVRNLLFVQRLMNPEEWSPFSEEDYRKYCTHNVSGAEIGILNALVEGGKPVWNTTAYLQPGYLEVVDEKYVLTDKMLVEIYQHLVS